MKKFFNFNVLFFITVVICLMIYPTNPWLWAYLIFEIAIFFVHGKKNFLNR